MKFGSVPRQEQNLPLQAPGIADFEINVREFAAQIGDHEFRCLNSISNLIDDASRDYAFIHALADKVELPHDLVDSKLIDIFKLFRKWHGHKYFLFGRCLRL